MCAWVNSFKASAIGSPGSYCPKSVSPKSEKGVYVKLKIGTWNVETMISRNRELAKTLRRRVVSVFCVREPKWKGAKAKEIGE